MEVKNAVITSVQLSTADHGCLSAWVNLDYGGTGQGFGGYSLYSPSTEVPDSRNYAGLFIWRVLEVVGVHEWDELVGRAVRVRADDGKVHALGLLGGYGGTGMCGPCGSGDSETVEEYGETW